MIKTRHRAVHGFETLQKVKGRQRAARENEQVAAGSHARAFFSVIQIGQVPLRYVQLLRQRTEVQAAFGAIFFEL